MINSNKRTNVREMIGKRFGRLVVLGETDRRSAGGHIIWFCQCDCGNRVEVMGGNLRRGNTFSCGCYFLENASAFAGMKKKQK